MPAKLDPVATAVLLDMLENIARQLETKVDPLQVAQQIRGIIALTEAPSEESVVFFKTDKPAADIERGEVIDGPKHNENS